MPDPVFLALDVEASGWAFATSDERYGEWRSHPGPLGPQRLTDMALFLAQRIAPGMTDLRKVRAAWVELPAGGVSDRWKHKALRPTFLAAGALMARLMQVGLDPERLHTIDYATWHRALCKGVPIPADIRDARPKWADHDLQTVAALKLRGFTCPVNWSVHLCDARGILEWALDRHRAREAGRPARRKGRR